jgi:hypothetical protein
MLDDKIIELQVVDIMLSHKKWISGEDFHGCSPTDFEGIMEAKYSYLAENANTLFKKACAGEVQYEWFSKMICMMRQIKSGTISHFDGSKQIGETLTDFYVKPLINDKKEKK